MLSLSYWPSKQRNQNRWGWNASTKDLGMRNGKWLMQILSCYNICHIIHNNNYKYIIIYILCNMHLQIYVCKRVAVSFLQQKGVWWYHYNVCACYPAHKGFSNVIASRTGKVLYCVGCRTYYRQTSATVFCIPLKLFFVSYIILKVCYVCGSYVLPQPVKFHILCVV